MEREGEEFFFFFNAGISESNIPNSYNLKLLSRFLANLGKEDLIPSDYCNKTGMTAAGRENFMMMEKSCTIRPASISEAMQKGSLFYIKKEMRKG